MTDKISALGCLISFESQETVDATAKFYTDANSDALVLNKWFAIQAMADNKDILSKVKQLKAHPDFILTNPNRARSLISTFAGNMPHFHNKNGSGYQFIADCIIEIDRLNPQVAARLASSFSQWKRYDEQRQELMKAELTRIKNTVNLSKDTFEVVTRCLK
jgi:aminopeptidase N